MAILCIAPEYARAIDGKLDATFGNLGSYPGYGFYYNLEDQPGEVSRPVKILASPNRYLYLVGVRLSTQNVRRLSIFRLNEDGTRDLEFGISGFVDYPMPSNAFQPADAIRDPSGRTWIAYNACNDIRLYRFDSEGDPDLNLLGSGFITIDFPGGTTYNADELIISATHAGTVLAAVGIRSLPRQVVHS